MNKDQESGAHLRFATANRAVTLRKFVLNAAKAGQSVKTLSRANSSAQLSAMIFVFSCYV